LSTVLGRLVLYRTLPPKTSVKRRSPTVSSPRPRPPQRRRRKFRPLHCAIIIVAALGPRQLRTFAKRPTTTVPLPFTPDIKTQLSLKVPPLGLRPTLRRSATGLRPLTRPVPAMEKHDARPPPI